MKISEDLKHELSSFIPFLEAAEKNPSLGGEWVVEPGQSPRVHYTTSVQNLIRILSLSHLIDPGYLNHLDQAWLRSADALDALPDRTIKSIVTAVVRGERFTDGFLLECLKNGYLHQLIRRICKDGADY